MKLVNLCGHPIDVLDELNNIIETIPPSATPIRVHHRSKQTGYMKLSSGQLAPLFTKAVVDAGSLPPPAPGVFYIVSVVVASVNRHRDDLVTPNVIEGPGRTPLGAYGFCTLL